MSKHRHSRIRAALAAAILLEQSRAEQARLRRTVGAATPSTRPIPDGTENQAASSIGSAESASQSEVKRDT